MHRNIQPSRLDTIAVPQIGTPNPSTLAIASLSPMRVVIRNVGPVVVFLAHSSSEIQSVGATAGVFQLPPGAEEVLVLVPRQGVWAVGQGAGGVVSVALSEALPTYWNES